MSVLPATIAQPGSIPGSFHAFQNFPPETKDMIWKLIIAMAAFRIVELRPDFRSPTTIPALLHVCSRSRELALKRWKLSFAVNNTRIYDLPNRFFRKEHKKWTYRFGRSYPTQKAKIYFDKESDFLYIREPLLVLPDLRKYTIQDIKEVKELIVLENRWTNHKILSMRYIQMVFENINHVKLVRHDYCAESRCNNRGPKRGQTLYLEPRIYGNVRGLGCADMERHCDEKYLYFIECFEELFSTQFPAGTVPDPPKVEFFDLIRKDKEERRACRHGFMLDEWGDRKY